MLETQKFLQSNPLEDINRLFAIDIKRHNKYPNLFNLKYDQINSPTFHPIVKECRGLVLDENDNYKVVCRSFDRFYNYGQEGCDEVDFNNCRIYDKADGSLLRLYFYDGDWQAATSGTPDASGSVGETWSKDFASLFFATLCEKRYNVPNDESYTYIFELVSPHINSVVKSKENDLIFLGVRNNKTGIEILPEEYLSTNKFNWNPVKYFTNFSNLDEIISLKKTINGSEQEGFVLCDKNFRRVKIKADDYIAKHHLISSFTIKDAIEVVRKGEIDEIATSFPEWKDRLIKINSALHFIINEAENSYSKFEKIEVQRDFAIEIRELPYSSLLFSKRNGKIKSIKDGVLTDMRTEGLYELIGRMGLILNNKRTFIGDISGKITEFCCGEKIVLPPIEENIINRIKKVIPEIISDKHIERIREKVLQYGLEWPSFLKKDWLSTITEEFRQKGIVDSYFETNLRDNIQEVIEIGCGQCVGGFVTLRERLTKEAQEEL